MKRKPAKKQRKAPSRKKSDWHFNHFVVGATAPKMDRIWDAFIDAVEKEGLYCGGSFHPVGVCRECKDYED